MSLPRIGITGRIASVEGADRTGVNASYLRAIAAAGGAPIILSPLAGEGAVASLLDGLEALVLSGGADVDPARYRAAPHPKLGALEPLRDAFELAVIAGARERTLPVLAICRGLQIMNVALRGTLWQDLPSEVAPHPQSGPRTQRVHGVEVDPGSRLAEALGTPTLMVNSFHHQAIRDLAPGLAATARASDGVIEGIEATDGWWMLGTQWHPEEFWREPTSPDQALFRALVTAIGAPRP